MPRAGPAETLRSVPRIYLAGLAVVTLIGTALRAHAVFYPLRHDEAYTFLTYGLQPVWTTLSVYNSPANHILHSALMRLSYQLLGNHEWAIRMPALAAGILAIPASFAAFAILADHASALLAAALVACSQALIAFSSNARGYSQAALLTLLMIILVSYLETRRSAAAWGLLVACAIASLYTIPSMLYGVAMFWTWMTLETASQRQGALRYRDVVVSGVTVGAVTALLYLPPLIRSGWDALFGNQFVAPLAWPNFASAFPGSVAAAWFDWHRQMPAAIGWALSLGFVAFVVGAALWGRRRSLLRLAMAALVASGAIVLVQRVAPPSRVWLFLLPLFLGMAATGLCSLAGRVRAALQRDRQRPFFQVVAVAAIIAVCVWMALPLARSDVFLADNEARDLPSIADYLHTALRPGDAVLAAPPLEWPLAYYLYRRQLPRDYVNAVRQESGRCFVVLDTRYTPERGSTVGKIVFDAHQASRLVLLKKWNAAALYELPAAVAPRREAVSAPNGSGRAAAASQNEAAIRK